MGGARRHSQKMGLLHDCQILQLQCMLAESPCGHNQCLPVPKKYTDACSTAICAGVPEQEASSQALLLSVALLMVMREAAGEGVRGLDGPELTCFRTLGSKFGASLPSAAAPLIIWIKMLGQIKDCCGLSCTMIAAFRGHTGLWKKLISHHYIWHQDGQSLLAQYLAIYIRHGAPRGTGREL